MAGEHVRMVSRRRWHGEDDGTVLVCDGTAMLPAASGRGRHWWEGTFVAVQSLWFKEYGYAPSEAEDEEGQTAESGNGHVGV